MGLCCSEAPREVQRERGVFIVTKPQERRKEGPKESYVSTYAHISRNKRTKPREKHLKEQAKPRVRKLLDRPSVTIETKKTHN